MFGGFILLQHPVIAAAGYSVDMQTFIWLEKAYSFAGADFYFKFAGCYWDHRFSYIME